MLAYYGTGRLWDDHREKRSEKYRENTRINGYIDCLDGRANIKLLLDWFKRMSIKSANNGKASLTYLAVKAAMEKCFRRLTGINDVTVMVNPDTYEIEINYYTEKDGRIQIPLEQTVLLETPGIVLIDEVDLHLHPEWQQRILKDLTDTFPKIQFIVTTHTPAIINSTIDGSLLVMEENSIDYLGAEAYGQDMNTIVKTFMGASVRPPEIQNKFDDLYRFPDENRIDEAKKVLDELKEKIDINDTELASCVVKIKLTERKIKK